MLDFVALKSTIAEKAYAVAEAGSRVRILMDMDCSFEGQVVKKGETYTLKEVDNMGVAYLLKDDGTMVCVPYVDGLYKKISEKKNI